jgi:hypothetical protein
MSEAHIPSAVGSAVIIKISKVGYINRAIDWFFCVAKFDPVVRGGLNGLVFTKKILNSHIHIVFAIVCSSIRDCNSGSSDAPTLVIANISRVIVVGAASARAGNILTN